MKATGIVRRIDDLGRIVIPKEIRRTMRIQEGDPLEIFTDRDGGVILKKYSPIGEFSSLAKIYAESLAQSYGCTVCITDSEQIIAAAGSGKKELQDKFLCEEVTEILKGRKTFVKKNTEAEYVRITEECSEYKQEVISVILNAGDVLGGIILLWKEEKKRLEDSELKIVKSAADLLGRQLS